MNARFIPGFLGTVTCAIATAAMVFLGGAQAESRKPAEILHGPGIDMPQLQASKAELIRKKLEALVIPDLQFTDVTLEEAVEFLRVKSRDLDTSKEGARGVNFILRGAPSTTKITLNLKDVPMIEALRYIAELGGAKVRIEPHAVIVEVVAGG
jgi:hypothetical protein